MCAIDEKATGKNQALLGGKRVLWVILQQGLLNGRIVPSSGTSRRSGASVSSLLGDLMMSWTFGISSHGRSPRPSDLAELEPGGRRQRGRSASRQSQEKVVQSTRRRPGGARESRRVGGCFACRSIFRVTHLRLLLGGGGQQGGSFACVTLLLLTEASAAMNEPLNVIRRVRQEQVRMFLPLPVAPHAAHVSATHTHGSCCQQFSVPPSCVATLYCWRRRSSLTVSRASRSRRMRCVRASGRTRSLSLMLETGTWPKQKRLLLSWSRRTAR